MQIEKKPQFHDFYNPEEPEKIEFEKKENLKKKIQESKKNVFEESGEHSPETLFEKMKNLEDSLRRQQQEGEGKLKDTIDEIEKGSGGQKFFVDKFVAYLPPKGEAVFIGDLHGDSEAVESIIEQSKFIEKIEKEKKDNFLVFLGDYADRGKKDIATVEEVINLKLKYPENVVLLRGNHEEIGIGSEYGFQGSLVKKYGEKKGGELFKKYNEMVKEMPGVVVTGNGIVGVHGGIPSQEIGSLNDLNDEEILYEMRWNDPTEETSERKDSERGPNFKLFGKKPFKRFMHEINGKLMIRSHECLPKGHKEMFDGKLYSIFSNGSKKSRSSDYKNKVENAIFIKVKLNQKNPNPKLWEVMYEKPRIEKG